MQRLWFGLALRDGAARKSDILSFLPVGNVLLGRGVAGKTDIPVISLPFPSISRKHCMIFVKHSGIYAEDLKSSYGTFINEKRVTGEVRLGNGDVLQLGYEKFLVKVK